MTGHAAVIAEAKQKENKMTDIPKITQRSLIAYSAVSGTPLPGEWYTAATRRNLGVSSLTAATLRFVADGERVTTLNFADNCRAVISGSAVDIECRFVGTDSPGVSYGVSGSGTLTLEVTTAGDAARGLEGATERFTVNVLVLDRDWPYASPTFLAFRVGETVDTVLSAAKHARGDWYSLAVNTGYGIGASGGQSIRSSVKVDGTYADSGLILHNQDGRMWISGTAARPGVYRVYFDLLSTVQGFGEGSQVYHPFEGGYGESALIIWIYRDWLPGDLVMVCSKSSRRPGKYALKVVRAPSWSGLGDELPHVEFARVETAGSAADDEPETVVGWRGSRVCRTEGGAVSAAYHYLFRKSWHNDPGVYVWELYGKADDSDTPPAAVADMTLLASHAEREFDDEVPPKQGWEQNGAAVDLVVTGDERWYVSAPAADAGWYCYAGSVTILTEGRENLYAEVCEREAHYIPEYAGWSRTGMADVGERYLVNVAGAWHVTPNLSDLWHVDDIAACPVVEPQDAHAETAVPFCPAKPGDVGLPVKLPGGAAVLQSLGNRYADAGELALLMDGLAGAMWRRYPLRRLLSLFKVGATVTMHLSVTAATTAYSETHNPSGESPESDNSGNYPDGVPSVAQIENAGGAIIVSKSENWQKEQLGISAHASADVTFDLDYALWNDGFPKYLEALVNRSTHCGNTAASCSHDRTVRTKSGSESKTYRVESITREEAIGRGIPFRGDGQGPRVWTISGGTARIAGDYWNEDGESASGGEGDWAYTYLWQPDGSGGGSYVSVGEEPFDGVADFSASVDGTGIVTVSACVQRDPDIDAEISDSGEESATASVTMGAPREEFDEEMGAWLPCPEGTDVTVSVSATAAAGPPTDSPGASGPHAGVQDPNDPAKVKVVYIAAETLGATETETVGQPSTASGHNFAAHGTVSLFFGEGRESNWPHRAIVAAAGGEGGMSVDFSTANTQRQTETQVTYGGYRHRAGGSDEWSYYVDGRQTGDPATWGTTASSSATDPRQPETLTESISHGATFNTGAVRLLLACAMGTLSASISSTAGAASGSAFGHRLNPVTGDAESADIPEVSGEWSSCSVTADGAPEYGSTSGSDISGSVDLSGEIDGGAWEQWGYEYNIRTTTLSGSIRIAITDTDFPAS